MEFYEQVLKFRERLVERVGEEEADRYIREVRATLTEEEAQRIEQKFVEPTNGES
jgi:DNA replication initiation complex subunit (GINS family)